MNRSMLRCFQNQIGLCRLTVATLLEQLCPRHHTCNLVVFACLWEALRITWSLWWHQLGISQIVMQSKRNSFPPACWCMSYCCVVQTGSCWMPLTARSEFVIELSLLPSTPACWYAPYVRSLTGSFSFQKVPNPHKDASDDDGGIWTPCQWRRHVSLGAI